MLVVQVSPPILPTYNMVLLVSTLNFMSSLRESCYLSTSYISAGICCAYVVFLSDGSDLVFESNNSIVVDRSVITNYVSVQF